MIEDVNILDRVYKLSHDLLVLSSQGERVAKDDGCLILYSIMRDNAYRIIKAIKDQNLISKENNNGK